MYCILEGVISGNYPTAPSKPTNFVDGCRAFELHNKRVGKPLCVQIPKVLVAMYEMRNNRSIGHVHGEINPNSMDAEFFARGAKWVMAELVRVFAGSNPADATRLVESITLNNFPAIWEVNGRKRILNPAMSYPDKVLALMYSETGSVKAKDLFAWTKHSHSTSFRDKVLKKLDEQSLIDFELIGDSVTISPTGRHEVERRRLLELA